MSVVPVTISYICTASWVDVERVCREIAYVPVCYIHWCYSVQYVPYSWNNRVINHPPVRVLHQ